MEEGSAVSGGILTLSSPHGNFQWGCRLQANLAEVAKTIRLRISHIPSGECDWECKLHALEVIFRQITTLPTSVVGGCQESRRFSALAGRGSRPRIDIGAF